MASSIYSWIESQADMSTLNRFRICVHERKCGIGLKEMGEFCAEKKAFCPTGKTSGPPPEEDPLCPAVPEETRCVAATVFAGLLDPNFLTRVSSKDEVPAMVESKFGEFWGVVGRLSDYSAAQLVIAAGAVCWSEYLARVGRNPIHRLYIEMLPTWRKMLTDAKLISAATDQPVVAEYIGGRTVQYTHARDINVLDPGLTTVTGVPGTFDVLLGGRYRDCSMERRGTTQHAEYAEDTYTCPKGCGSWYGIWRYSDGRVMYVLGPYNERCVD